MKQDLREVQYNCTEHNRKESNCKFFKLNDTHTDCVFFQNFICTYDVSLNKLMGDILGSDWHDHEIIDFTDKFLEYFFEFKKCAKQLFKENHALKSIIVELTQKIKEEEK